MAALFDYWLADITSLILALFATIYVFFKYNYGYWKRKKVYYVQPKFPFGNVKELFTQNESMGELFERFYFQLNDQKYAGIYQLYKPALLVRDPEIIKDIMIKKFENFNGRGLYYDENNDPLSAHLFNMAGPKWKNLRTKMSPTFTSGKMKMMFETFARCGEQLNSHLRNFGIKGDVVEVKDLLSRYTTDIVASCAFGLESNCLKNPDAEFRVWGRKFFATTLKSHIRDVLLLCSPALAKTFKIPECPKDVTKYFIDVVKETIEYREKNNVSRNDFMQLLIQLKNKGFVDPDKVTILQKEKEISGENVKPSIEELAAQAFVFYVAGFETSATTMTFCLYELAKQVDVQTKLRNEIRSVLNKYNGKVTYEAIHEMEYLDKVISETLRVHPPVPVLNRVCNKDYTIEETGDVIQKGISVVISTRGLHRDGKYFPNPNVFNPENFSESAIKGRPTYVYMPFGEGPRICIGQRFGLLQVKVGLVSVLRDNEVSLSPKTLVPPKLDKKSFITSPEGGMWLNIATVD